MQEGIKKTAREKNNTADLKKMLADLKKMLAEYIKEFRNSYRRVNELMWRKNLIHTTE